MSNLIEQTIELMENASTIKADIAAPPKPTERERDEEEPKKTKLTFLEFSERLDEEFRRRRKRRRRPGAARGAGGASGMGAASGQAARAAGGAGGGNRAAPAGDVHVTVHAAPDRAGYMIQHVQSHHDPKTRKTTTSRVVQNHYHSDGRPRTPEAHVAEWGRRQAPIVTGLAHGLVHGDLARHFKSGLIAAGSHFANGAHRVITAAGSTVHAGAEGLHHAIRHIAGAIHQHFNKPAQVTHTTPALPPPGATSATGSAPATEPADAAKHQFRNHGPSPSVASTRSNSPESHMDNVGEPWKRSTSSAPHEYPNMSHDEYRSKVAANVRKGQSVEPVEPMGSDEFQAGLNSLGRAVVPPSNFRKTRSDSGVSRIPQLQENDEWLASYRERFGRVNAIFEQADKYVALCKDAAPLIAEHIDLSIEFKKHHEVRDAGGRFIPWDGSAPELMRDRLKDFLAKVTTVATTYEVPAQDVVKVIDAAASRLDEVIMPGVAGFARGDNNPSVPTADEYPDNPSNAGEPPLDFGDSSIILIDPPMEQPELEGGVQPRKGTYRDARLDDPQYNHRHPLRRRAAGLGVIHSQDQAAHEMPGLTNRQWQTMMAGEADQSTIDDMTLFLLQQKAKADADMAYSKIFAASGISIDQALEALKKYRKVGVQNKDSNAEVIGPSGGPGDNEQPVYSGAD
jgi:hypothetical protein